MVILDTNIIIDHLRQKGNGKSILLKAAEKHDRQDLAISVLTVEELYEGKSTQSAEKEKSLLAVLSSLTILSYNFEIAERAGKIMRDLKRSITFVDAAIAATAIHHESELLTLNKKDFAGIEGLLVLDPRSEAGMTD